jgi:hypothetical protein
MRTGKPSPSSPAAHVVAEPCGVPSPKTAIRTLDDGTVLLPRCRHTTHQAHVLSLDAHIIGRVYGRDDLCATPTEYRRRLQMSGGGRRAGPV